MVLQQAKQLSLDPAPHVSHTLALHALQAPQHPCPQAGALVLAASLTAFITVTKRWMQMWYSSPAQTQVNAQGSMACSSLTAPQALMPCLLLQNGCM